VRRALWRAAAVALLAAAAATGTASAAPTHVTPKVRSAPVNGTIEGTVTDAVTHAAIVGIEVCALSLTAEVEESTCALTNGAGAYRLVVPPGEYIVGFFSPFSSKLNYVTMFQGGATTFEEAFEHPLTVTGGGIDAGVNAAMHEGGHIAGHVASAEHPEVGIEGIKVCAERPHGEEGFGCTTTGEGGAYKVNALPAGEYVVHFADPLEGDLDYVPQFYEDSATLKGAKLVTVTVGATTSGIDALLSLGGEIDGKVTAAPGGAPLAGAIVWALTSEKKRVALAFTDGKGEYALHGLAPGMYVVVLEATGYESQYYPSAKTFELAQRIPVAAGTGVGLLTTELLPEGYVPPPPVEPVHPPPPSLGGGQTSTAPPQGGPPAGGVAGATAHTPGILFSSTRLRSSHGHVSVTVSCSGAPCTGTIRLTIRVAYRVRRHGHFVTLHRTIVLAQGSFSLAAGAHTTISLRETAAGLAHLAHAGRHPVLAQLLGSVGGGAASTLTVHVA
jgi:hypothetical protein